jgi:tellurite resistance protein TerC
VGETFGPEPVSEPKELQLNAPLWAWAALIGAVILLTVVDVAVFGRGQSVISIKSAALWSAVWLALGLGFTAIIYAAEGGTPAGEYATGYLIERVLSLDNLFVFAIIFSYFGVPAHLQPRVLLWGVLGALVLRGIFIAVGAAALDAAHWVIYVFGAFLVYTAVKLGMSKGEEVHPERNIMLRLIRRVIPLTDGFRGTKVFSREGAKLMATPLLAVFLVVASTDVIFAIDSIPAIFAITTDTFLVFAANAFAVMGMRALYFLLAGALSRFEYLNYGLALVLGLVGAKMLASGVYHPPIWLTLIVIVVVLSVAIGASLWATRGREPAPLEPKTG